MLANSLRQNFSLKSGFSYQVTKLDVDKVK